MEKLFSEGLKQFFEPVLWGSIVSGMVYFVVAPKGRLNEYNGIPLHHCVFQLPNDLCSLHESGLKPLEGKLAHHGMGASEAIRKSVAEAWANEEGFDFIVEHWGHEIFLTQLKLQLKMCMQVGKSWDEIARENPVWFMIIEKLEK